MLQLRWKTLQRGIRELLLQGGEKSKQVLEKLDKVNEALTALDRGDLEKAKRIAKEMKLDLSASPDADELRKKLEDEYPHVTKFENSERIRALWKQTGFFANLPGIGNRGPSYIEPRIFALTLVETLGDVGGKKEPADPDLEANWSAVARPASFSSPSVAHDSRRHSPTEMWFELCCPGTLLRMERSETSSRTT